MSTHPEGVSGIAQTPHPANSSVASVNVDLETKLVTVHGSDIDGEAVIAAIDEAGYDAVTT